MTTRTATQYADTTELFNHAEGVLGPHLLPLVSGRRNARYGTGHILRPALYMCASNTDVYNALDDMAGGREGAARRAHPAVPTPQWWNGRVGKCHPDTMLQVCGNALNASLERAGGGRPPAGDRTVSIDTHNIACHDAEPDPDRTVGTPHERGTSRAQCFATIQVTGNALPLTMGCRPVGTGSRLDGLVAGLVDDCAGNGLVPKRVLMDRQFYSVGVVRELESRGMEFLMPAVKRRNVKRMIMAVHNDGHGPAFDVVMRSKRYGSARVRHVVCRKPNADKFASICDMYVVFCTNIPVEGVPDAPRMLLRIYGRRWRIETGYRIIEQVQGKTRSRSYSVRLFRFFMMLVYANMWLMLNAMGEGRRENGIATRRGIPVRRFQAMVANIILWMYCAACVWVPYVERGMGPPGRRRGRPPNIRDAS